MVSDLDLQSLRDFAAISLMLHKLSLFLKVMFAKS